MIRKVERDLQEYHVYLKFHDKSPKRFLHLNIESFRCSVDIITWKITEYSFIWLTQLLFTLNVDCKTFMRCTHKNISSAQNSVQPWLTIDSRK